MKFTHLHNHNEYSQLDGVGTAEQYTKEAVRLEYKYLGITNHSNVDGCIKFQKACKDADIKSIIGCEFYIVDNITVSNRETKRYHICCYVKTQEGWQNILKMLTIANLEGFYRKPRIDRSILFSHCKGIKITTACSSSFIMASWGESLLLDLYSEIDRNNLFLEIMPHQTLDQIATNKMVMLLAKKYNFQIMASNDCHYPTAEGALAQEVLLAVQRKAKWKDKNRWRFEINNLFLNSPEEMATAFAKQGIVPKDAVQKAMETSYYIAKSCSSFEINKLPIVLPTVKGLENIDETEMLTTLSRQGLKKRIIEQNEKTKPIREYTKRLTEELDLICKLKYQRYFLIVWELINWCKNNDIMVGPGRGSVGGCLVAYLLNITDVDPIRHDLLFARFISPARIDFPDIDMDFEDQKRYLVKKHLEDCYGKDNVTGLSTFLTLKGRAALRDVSRVFNVPIADVNSASKSIVVRSGGDFRSDFTIEDAFDTFEDGIKFKKKYPEVTQIAISLEGQVRGSGQHAAAICISKEDLKEGTRCNLCKRTGITVANWDKEDAEYMGLMKLDILGLSALSVLNQTRAMIKCNYKVNINFGNLPLDDENVYKAISRGHTVGAFQIGSMGLSSYCKELGVNNFEDLVHATSLWRPGTLRSGLTTEFVERKNGKPYKAIHPLIRELTKDTYGIILYQEQIMRLMYELAGLPWKTCDVIRKVVSKSQGEELFLKFRDLFAEGCYKLGTLNKKTAGSIWEELSSFGSYGFNKSHAVGYSLITYWEMYCKVNYPAEFMACSLTYGAEDKKNDYVSEAKRLGLKIILPKIGISDITNWKTYKNEKELYAPFIEIKGIGEKTARKILDKSIEDNTKRFFKLKNNSNSKTVKIIKDIHNYEETNATREETESTQNFFRFNISSKPMFNIEGIFDFIKGKLSVIESINFSQPSKKDKLFFGKLLEIKFGYRQSVLKVAKDDKTARINTAGTSDSLGGVYGFFKDSSATANAMLVFNSELYSRKKDAVEHCGNKWMLISANYPRKATNNLFCNKLATEEDLLRCEFDNIEVNLIKFPSQFPKNKESLFACKNCELRKEVEAPVPLSRGRKNVMILGESPGKEENIMGKGFVGKAGSEILWPELHKHGFLRKDFIINNAVKCFPKIIKTPTKKQISICSSKWLDNEIITINPILVLALGNTPLYYFNNKESGISQLNGSTEWNERHKLWICWCIHPASVLYEKENKKMFEEGIANFTKCIKNLSANYCNQ